MRILVTKDSSTKIPREVADLDEARNIAATGMHVELLNDDGSTEPLPALEQPDADLVRAAAEMKAAQFSAIEESALSDVNPAIPAKKAAAKKTAAPAKKAPAKRR